MTIITLKQVSYDPIIDFSSDKDLPDSVLKLLKYSRGDFIEKGIGFSHSKAAFNDSLSNNFDWINTKFKIINLSNEVVYQDLNLLSWLVINKKVSMFKYILDKKSIPIESDPFLFKNLNEITNNVKKDKSLFFIEKVIKNLSIIPLYFEPEIDEYIPLSVLLLKTTQPLSDSLLNKVFQLPTSPFIIKNNNSSFFLQKFKRDFNPLENIFYEKLLLSFSIKNNIENKKKIRL